MSNHHAIAAALGLTGGALLWHFTRPTPARSAATTAPPSGPPRSDAPCALKLDAAGLTADGAIVDVPGAVARCQHQRRGDLVVAANAPAATLAQLTAAMQAAGVTLTRRVV
jgi:hypothetical protein